MRNDLSNWLLHFVHQRDSETDPLLFAEEDYPDYSPIPDVFDYSGQPHYYNVDYEEQYYGLDYQASGFHVLQKILYQGFLRSGWSFRKVTSGALKPTIFGPKPAVCFTEMPLHGFIDYTESRKSKFMGGYGIAFRRDELFKAGARPVIYGTTLPYKEANIGDPFYGLGLRTISSESGIGIKEQYRFVSTSFSKDRTIDWTHEREWRWADINELHLEYGPNGLQFYLDENKYSFTEVFILVRTEKEVRIISDQLKRMFMGGTTEFGLGYNTVAIRNTKIVSIEYLKSSKIELSTIKFENIPHAFTRGFTLEQPSTECMNDVRYHFLKAKEVATEEARKFYLIHDNGKPNGFDLCGFANLVTYETNSEVTAALVHLGIADAYKDGFRIYFNCTDAQEISVHEIAARTAADYLSKHLNQEFFVNSFLD